MKKILGLLLVSAILLTSLSIASTKEYKIYKVAGKIVEINIEKGFLIIKPFWKNPRNMKFYISEETEILQKGEKSSVKQLKQGLSVAITYKYYKKPKRKRIAQKILFN